MATVAEGSKAVDNMVEKALQIHAEVRAYLETTNAKYKVDVDKYCCANFNVLASARIYCSVDQW